MPSASAKSSQSQAQFNMSDLLQEPLKGAVSVMEKKLRNLEKRKLKLYEYQKKLKQGSDLSDEQKKAAENLILVENSLETVKELHKLMVAMEQEYAKASKKEAKRLKQESLNQVEAKAVEAARKVIHIQAVLGLLSEDVKPAFLAGSDGACRLSAEDFLKLDQVYELVNPTEQDNGQKLSDIVSSCSTHLIGLIEEKDKEIFNGTTYRDVSDLIKKVANSGYFDKCARTGEKDEEAGSVAVKEEAAARPVSPGCESPVDSGSSGHSSHADPEEAQQGYYQEQSAQHTAEAAHFVNGLGGVDLPPEVEDHPGDYDDDGIDFMGESEIVTTSTVRLEAAPESAHRDDQPPPSLNAGSPEFIPRSMQAIPDTADYLDADSLEVAHPVADAEAENLSEQAAADSGWQSVTSQSQHHTGGFRGGRGRGGRGTFNRGVGRGRGSRGGGYQDRGSREGGEHRGNREGGEYRGNRDGGEYRGNREGGEYRGGRQDGGGFQRARGSGGGYRGNRGSRGGSGGERNFRGGSRGSSRGGGFGRPQQPQAQP